MKRTCILLALVFAIAVKSESQTVQRQSSTAPFVAGFRASRVLGSYPNRQFPSVDYWISAGQQMARKFSGAAPAGIWIVSLYQGSGVTQMNFPGDGRTYPNIQFIGTDQNESYLSRFDSAGFNIWLQVEPGAASMDTLISLVLSRYKQHPCVKGFGVDVEWYYTNTNSGGRKLTDGEALSWESKVKSFDSTYTLFLKHYAPSWMPPSYRGSILFVDDSQQFPSLSSMVSEFKAWGTKFAPNNVAFQFGYKVDTTWWRQYADPPSVIGSALRSAVPNCSGLFWVDFTITSVFPMTSIQDDVFAGPASFELFQNYPNPFNAGTIIGFRIPIAGLATMKIFDLLGRERMTAVHTELSAGSYQVTIDGSGLASGTYYYRLRVGEFVQTRKFILQK
ncbi:MAG: T9SS type A sorting domain-containing protein [Ignavibacteriales bacterium]|nr:T9SS type A sorting domain-containing protein [Ignavibacteriales bacterium]